MAKYTVTTTRVLETNGGQILSPDEIGAFYVELDKAVKPRSDGLSGVTWSHTDRGAITRLEHTDVVKDVL